MTQRMSTEKRRSQIVDAAIKIIGERGLREFTAAQIAQEVGIKDGTIFRHFNNKDEIVMGMLDRLEGILAETIPPPSSDPLERLGQFFFNRLELITTQPGIQSLVFSDQLCHAGGEAALKRVTEFRKQGREYIQLCLREAAENEVMSPELNPTDVVVLITGAIMALAFLAKDNPSDEPIEARAQHLWQTLLSLIRR